MKNNFALEVNTPCLEKFNDFTKTKSGGFCAVCTKEVIDFTKMNDEAIKKYFEKKSEAATCGRFYKSQLKSYEFSNYKTNYWLAGIGMFLLSFLGIQKTNAQSDITSKNIKEIKQEGSILVSGIVSDETGSLPGVNVYLENTNIGVETNFDGEFEFPKRLKIGDVLLFSFIGMETKRVVITDENSAKNVQLKVVMNSDSCILLGKVAVKGVYKSKTKK